MPGTTPPDGDDSLIVRLIRVWTGRRSLNNGDRTFGGGDREGRGRREDEDGLSPALV